MIQVNKITINELEEKASALGVNLPIEQTRAWADYQATIPGRSAWGCVEVARDGEVVALASLFDYETHGYHYLRSAHGPVWVAERDEALEAEALEALAAYVRGADKKVAFARLAVAGELECAQPVLSTRPYNQTVVIDLAGGTEEDILGRMKPRGRRDVRKALRESPATCADETELAAKSFAEYYDVMVETGKRDDFVPAPCSDYEDMIRILGPEHCRVYAGRIDGRVVTWSIVTVSGTRAVRYYGASRSESMRQHVTDKLVLFECVDLFQNKGCADYDMMGIGSDFAPELMGLNEFKTKFAKNGVVDVAPDRDLPIKKTFYKALQAAKKLRDRT
ncbi:MAG: peptidoglycan bridge formation glycyltransferase FemA/FemB family protein [Coriobacteriia bacterium]|nr:peptidoglycan bridge formation glycyltransferase FemA/FemB family protein [Coriobacteriia bacterium]